ncbi:hypothetical protein DM01DRAFT_1320506 [Hesseltinella vesiculosa]|uniref:PQ-loop-domain-containing protein n=1 Tax=Hesseltinella vesiculosa TaxID=101127 RepID=A0A1X2GKR4_9FUNG|nr:hypothetical protein DM01DRAFT_1320506 [Hesseltinella vesiculosa]
MTQCIPSKDGVPYTQWIYYLFGDCTYGVQDTASLLLGYFSILFWLNAQLPQVVENYRRGSAQGLSFNFLSIWLAGDVANLIGCILTNQLPFQRYLGTYFVCVDITLVCQYIYYYHIKRVDAPPKLAARPGPYPSASEYFQHPSVNTPLLIQHPLEDEIAPYSTSSSPSKWYTLSDQHSSHSSLSSSTSRSTTFMALFFLFSFQRLPETASVLTKDQAPMDSVAIGFIFAWICTTLYLMSRIPQIVKNYHRHSVDGLSPSLFIFAVLGNLTYSTSILIHPGQTAASLMDAFPYLLGSAGTLMFDFTIFVQFVWYTRQKRKQEFKRIQLAA